MISSKSQLTVHYFVILEYSVKTQENNSALKNPNAQLSFDGFPFLTFPGMLSKKTQKCQPNPRSFAPALCSPFIHNENTNTFFFPRRSSTLQALPLISLFQLFSSITKSFTPQNVQQEEIYFCDKSRWIFHSLHNHISGKKRVL